MRRLGIISLLFVGVSLACTDDGGGGNESDPATGSRVLIYMNPDADQGEIEAVNAFLQESEEVDDFIYVDKQEAYERAAALYEDDPGLVAALHPESLPVSFQAILGPEIPTKRFIARAERMAGVGEVVTDPEFGKEQERRQALGACFEISPDMFVFVNRHATEASQAQIDDVLAHAQSVDEYRIYTSDETDELMGCLGSAQTRLGGLAIVSLDSTADSVELRSQLETLPAVRLVYDGFPIP